MKLCFILCEGKHDIAFLSRLINETGFASQEKGISKLPAPFDTFIPGQLRRLTYDDLILGNFLPPLPKKVYHIKDKAWLFLYRVEGDNYKKTKHFVQSFIDYSNKLTVADSTMSTHTGDPAFLIFADADDNLKSRLNSIHKHYRDLFLGIDELKNKKFKTLKKAGAESRFLTNVPVGIYIFHKPSDESEGRLEDIVLTLAEKNHKSLLDEARIYTDANKYFKDKLPANKRRNFYPQKACLSIAGQMQKSGASLDVILEQSALIADEDIKNDPTCQEITKFLKDFIAYS